MCVVNGVLISRAFRKKKHTNNQQTTSMGQPKAKRPRVTSHSLSDLAQKAKIDDDSQVRLVWTSHHHTRFSRLFKKGDKFVHEDYTTNGLETERNADLPSCVWLSVSEDKTQL